MALHPCLTCGACCAFYRASFYWAEADDVTPGGVPVELTKKLTPHLLVMKGTQGPSPRCIALKGTIGEKVYCSIYPQRSSVCREFEPSWQNNTPNPRCDQARYAWGLPPLNPDSWRGISVQSEKINCHTPICPEEDMAARITCS